MTSRKLTCNQSGALQNIAQTNCPTVASCSTSLGCECPVDLNGDTGVLINQFTGYQCAYIHGACTWDHVCSGIDVHNAITDVIYV